MKSLILWTTATFLVLVMSGICFGQAEWIKGDTTVLAFHGGASITPSGSGACSGGIGLWGHLNVGAEFEFISVKHGFGGNSSYSGGVGYIEYLPLRTRGKVLLSGGIAASVGSLSHHKNIATASTTLYTLFPISKSVSVAGASNIGYVSQGDAGSGQAIFSGGFAFRLTHQTMLITEVQQSFARKTHATGFVGGLVFVLSKSK